MGLGDKLIQRLEQQSETLAELRRLEEKHRGRICELERKLGDAEREQDIARVEIETLRQERDLARAEIMTWRVSDDSLRKDRDHWKQARQDAIEAGELMQAEIETLRQQLDAAQAEVTRERLDAEERGEKLDRLHEDHARLGRVVRHEAASCTIAAKTFLLFGRRCYRSTLLFRKKRHWCSRCRSCGRVT